MPELKSQTPLSSSAQDGRDLPGCAFHGWLDAGEPHQAGAPAVVHSADGKGKAAATAPGFRLEFDPTRVRLHLSLDAVTAWTGSPQHPSTRSFLEPVDIAATAAGLVDGGLAPGGRFAVIHADLLRRQVTLITDRFAVHSLCYAQEKDLIRFSDRADQVLPFPYTQIDLQGIYDYLYFHVIPAPRTIYVGVRRLEGAQAAILSNEAEKLVCTWRPDFSLHGSGTKQQRMDRFLEIVRRSVEADSGSGHIGAYLSGGTDSSTIAGFLTQLRGPSTSAFSIGFHAHGYDEMAYAQLAARHFGCQHHAYYVTPDDLVKAIPLVARFYDQPFGNSSALPAYYCSLLARSHGIDRMLAGDGGDELFGGNARYAKQKVLDFYWRVPAALRDGLLEPMSRVPWAQGAPFLRKVCSYVAQARLPMPARMESYNLLHRIGAERLLTPHFMQGVKTDLPPNLQAAVYQRNADAALVNGMLAYDWRFTLTDNDLPKVLGTAALAGIEVAFPLLSDELVDFSLTLSPREKVRGLVLRHFFKKALAGFLPTEIIRKKKHGFGLPFGPWLLESRPLRHMAQHSVNQLVLRRLIDPAAAASLFSERLAEHAGYYGELIWVLMMLEEWLAAHAPNFAID